MFKQDENIELCDKEDENIFILDDFVIKFFHNKKILDLFVIIKDFNPSWSIPQIY